MSTADRVLATLNLFTMDRPRWTVEEAAEALNLPVSTAYRYIRSLTQAGLIVNDAAGRYVVGPGVFELDWQARNSDPLILAATPVMRDMVDEMSDDVLVMLCRIYRMRVMCVHQLVRGGGLPSVSYERGRPMPLYRGSASKVILAHLPTSVLKKCFDGDAADIQAAGLGADYDAFRVEMRAIRRAGAVVSRAEIDSGIMGISAPIMAPDASVTGSISIVAGSNGVSDAQCAAWIAMVQSAGATITDALGDRR